MPRSTDKNTTAPVIDPTDFYARLREQARGAIRTLLEATMQEELTHMLNAQPFERKETRRGQRNGYYQRDLVTTEGRIDTLKVPRDRDGQFQTQVFESYRRYSPEIEDAVTQMFVSGVSQAKVATVVEPLLGTAPSASAVSRMAKDMQSECDAWRKRSLADYWRVIYIDGVYFPIIHDGMRDSTPLLVALGVDQAGYKEVLAIAVAGQESSEAWDGLLVNLMERGVKTVDLFVTDGDEGLICVLGKRFPSAKRQRCVTHKMRNVCSKVPKRVRVEIGAALRGIFSQETREKAQLEILAFRGRYEKSYPEAVTCLLTDLDACLTYYAFPPRLRKHIRTTNALEGLFHTVRLRTDSMGVFQNEASCLTIVYATIMATKLHRVSV